MREREGTNPGRIVCREILHVNRKSLVCPLRDLRRRRDREVESGAAHSTPVIESRARARRDGQEERAVDEGGGRSGRHEE